jgi:hypothetical protein
MFAESFITSSLACFSFVACQLCGNSVFSNTIFSREEVCVWGNLFCVSQAWLHYSGYINPLNAELNPICHLPALLGAYSPR